MKMGKLFVTALIGRRVFMPEKDGFDLRGTIVGAYLTAGQAHLVYQVLLSDGTLTEQHLLDGKWRIEEGSRA